MSELTFTAYGTPQPQGSAKAFVRGNRAYITSANKKMMPYRHSLTQIAMETMSRNALEAPLCARGVAVEVHIVWTLAKPKSTPTRVKEPTKKPDADKLLRCCLDALTGVAYDDDSQVCHVTATKVYGAVEMTQVTVRAIQ
jgi:Holliday junction resolvase RusA-like endonuclease